LVAASETKSDAKTNAKRLAAAFDDILFAPNRTPTAFGETVRPIRRGRRRWRIHPPGLDIATAIG
jgi:hypothetical protein